MKTEQEIIDFLNKYTEQEICEELDNEIINWIEEDWSENYESEYEWYIDHNNKEAEDKILESLKNEIEIFCGGLIPENIDVYGLIKNKFDILN
jgi:hypothetical protein